MAKVRSPSYPSIGLKEAVEKASNIFAQNYQSPVPREVAAVLMGYGGLNGKSLGVLAALTKYGLLEGRGDDTRVSDLAVRIIAHEDGMPERAEALAEAASRPELFKEIDARYNGGKASDAAIRAYLITQKFIPTAADSVIRTYRETKSLLKPDTTITPLSLSMPELAETGDSEHKSSASTSQLKLAPTIGANDDDPYQVSISGSTRMGKTISGQFTFKDQESVDELIDVLNAMKMQLAKRSSSEETQ